MSAFEAKENVAIIIELDEGASFEYGIDGVLDSIRGMFSQCERGKIRFERLDIAPDGDVSTIQLEFREAVFEDSSGALQFVNDGGYSPDQIKVLAVGGSFHIWYPVEVEEVSSEVEDG